MGLFRPVLDTVVVIEIFSYCFPSPEGSQREL